MRKLIPSMFHRRLLMLFSGLGIVAVALIAQMVRLTVVEGADRLRIAEARLDRRDYLPTFRGRILDRNNVELAVDRPSFDVAVDYEVISGVWAMQQAGRAARQRHRGRWAEMSPEARGDAIVAELPAFDAEVERLWRAIESLGGITELARIERTDRIRREVENTALRTWTRQQAAEEMKHNQSSSWLNISADFEAQPIREQRQPHVILSGVSDEVAFEFRRLAGTLPGLHVTDSWQREYPWRSVEVMVDRAYLPRPLRSDDPVLIRVEGVADHILGNMRNRIFADDVARRPFTKSDGTIDLGGYRVGDHVGSRGLEAVFEDNLRGLRGMIDRQVHTGEQDRTEPTPGDDLLLGLDIRLQARIQGLMSPEYGLARVHQFHAGWNNDGSPRPSPLPVGRPLNGAVVVIDIDSGEILSMVSTPTIAMGERMSRERAAIEHPYVNRAVDTPYPPGSIIKPLVLSAAVAEGVHRIEQAIVCTGQLLPDHPNMLRCWIYREAYGFQTHGAIDATQALAVSCNIFFYVLADRLGIDRLTSWYARFGLGTPLDVGLLHVQGEGDDQRMLGESGGEIPSDVLISKLRRERALRATTPMLGIGQGPVTWTPVQAANAYATLARYGVVRDATLLRRDPRGRSQTRQDNLRLDPYVVETILEGLRQSVEESHGTGSVIRYADGSREPIITAPDVRVWAKTGTAQAPAMPVDDTGDGTPDRFIQGLSHAWFVGLVGEKEQGRPKYAVAVILEYGGSGGRAAGPIANQVIRALQAEGYL